ncbi:MAG: von Willebrand factor type A domain-containing protein, partial [Marinoscillum sp.]
MLKTKIKQLYFLLLVLLLSCEDYSGDEGFSYAQTQEGFATTGDQYNEIVENPFVTTEDQPVSTFSIDADGASYANVRRFIQEDRALPPANAVRTEELINYFDLEYEYKTSEHPISLNGEVSECPWKTGHKLIRIGIKGKPIDMTGLNSNFVFLIDVSGSMSSEDKLDLLKGGFK